MAAKRSPGNLRSNWRYRYEEAFTEELLKDAGKRAKQPAVTLAQVAEGAAISAL